jgi:uncharacterized protein (TIGR03437 family)
MTVTLKRLFLALFVLTAATALLLQSGQLTEAEARGAGHTGKRAQGTPTFNKEVVRLFQQHCQSCHHPGDIGPFSLMSYKEARPWAVSIREQVITKAMPPWKPLNGCGDFKDARALTPDEINTIAAWADGGAPEGNAADLPKAIEFTEGWPQGQPDFVATPTESFTPPLGKDTYRCFSVPTSQLRGDRWIQGLDVQPGNRKIVHHVIAYADPLGKSIELDQREAGPGYTCFGGPGFDISLGVNEILSGNSPMLGGWAPGSRGYFAPEGNGVKLPSNASARVVLQVHYHPTGEAETDLTSVGFYFAQKPVSKAMLPLPLVNQSFSIPAGAKAHQVTANFTALGFSGKILGITPHMHLLGKQIKVEMTQPGQPKQCLVNIPNWNFNWQGSYLYQQPISFAANSRVDLTCVFDNSTENPLQPNNPPKAVTWGEETTDEMALAFVAFTLDALTLPASSPQLAEVTTDNQGNLLISGSGFNAGADIEINGQRVRDTQNEAATQSTKLQSGNLWKVFAAPGQSVNVTVINPDGVRTTARPFTRNATARPVAAVSAASFAAGAVAPESIVAAFGEYLASGIASATVTPLPTDLAGTTVRVNGLLAPLFFVSPQQINFQLPAGVSPGTAIIEITTSDGQLSRSELAISSIVPSLFTANAAGTGLPIGVVSPDGINFYPLSNPDGSPAALNGGEYLVLFGTGFRKAARESVQITIGGRPVQTIFTGAQGGLVGLDQLNTELPAGVSGLANVVVTANGKQANVVQVRLK